MHETTNTFRFVFARSNPLRFGFSDKRRTTFEVISFVYVLRSAGGSAYRDFPKRGHLTCARFPQEREVEKRN